MWHLWENGINIIKLIAQEEHTQAIQNIILAYNPHCTIPAISLDM